MEIIKIVEILEGSNEGSTRSKRQITQKIFDWWLKLFDGGNVENMWM